MPLAVAEGQSAGQSSGPMTVTLAAGSAVGDLLVVIFANDYDNLADLQTPTGTAASTWTLRDSFDGGTNLSHIKTFTAPVTTAGAQTVICTTTDANNEHAIGVWRIPGGAFDVAGHANGTTSTSHAAPSLVPATTDAIYCCLWTSNDAGGGVFNYTYPGAPFAGLTERDCSTFSTFGFGSEAITSGVATGTRTATASVTHPWCAAAILVKSAASPPSIVGSATTSGNGVSGTSVSVPVPANAAVDDIAAVFLARTNVTTAITPPAGFAIKDSFNTSGGLGDGQFFWKRLTAADTGNYTFSWTNPGIATAQCVLIRNCAPTGSPWELGTGAAGFATRTTGTWGSVTSSSTDTTDPAGMVLFAVVNTTAGTHTPPTGFTELADNDIATMAYRIPGAAGTQTQSGASVSSSSNAGSWLLGIKSRSAPLLTSAVTATGATGTQTSGSWATTSNATGAANGTFAVWTSIVSASTGTLELTGWNGQTMMGGVQPATINAVTADVNQDVSAAIARMTSVTAQLFSGTTAIGSAVALTLQTTNTVQTITFPVVPTWAQCTDLRVKIVYTKSGTTSCNGQVDALAMTISYSPVLTTTYTKAGTAAGSGAPGGAKVFVPAIFTPLRPTVVRQAVAQAANW